MSHTLAPADVSHYYQRLAELSTLPFWQREEFTEPAGPERGHVWHKLLLHWLPNVEPLELPDLTHLLHAQDPALVAGGLTGFFARHPVPEPL